MGSSLLSQDKVTPTQAAPLLSPRNWAPGAQTLFASLPHGGYHCLGEKTRLGGEVHRLWGEHPNKGLPLRGPLNHLPVLELSPNLGEQCFLESLAAVGLFSWCFWILTWRRRAAGADSRAWVLAHSPPFRATAPEKTKPSKTCHFGILPTPSLFVSKG